MIALSRELNREKQIDRACAAQSPDMLPKVPVNKVAQREAVEARVRAQFKGM